MHFSGLTAACLYPAAETRVGNLASGGSGLYLLLTPLILKTGLPSKSLPGLAPSQSGLHCSYQCAFNVVIVVL